MKAEDSRFEQDLTSLSSLKLLLRLNPTQRSDVLIIQRFFDPQDKYTESEEEPGAQIEKDVDQFIIDKVYGSSVIITNSSSSGQQFQVLIEVPEGAIPVQELDYTKSHTLQLNAFSTRTVEIYFYFPYTGSLQSESSKCFQEGKVVAIGKEYHY